MVVIMLIVIIILMIIGGVVIWCFMLLSFVHAVAWYSDVEYPATDDDNGSDVGDSH